MNPYRQIGRTNTIRNDKELYHSVSIPKQNVIHTYVPYIYTREPKKYDHHPFNPTYLHNTKEIRIIPLTSMFIG